MRSRIACALVFLAAMAGACSTFNGVPLDTDGGGDGGTTTPGPDGGGGQDGGGQDGGGQDGSGTDAGAGCVPLALFVDAFERGVAKGPGWTSEGAGGGAALTMTMSGSLEKDNSLVVTFPAGANMDAQLGRPLADTACVVDASFLLRVVGIVPAGAKIVLLRIELASTNVDVVLNAAGTISVREATKGNVDGSTAAVGDASPGVTLRVSVRLDITKAEISATVGPPSAPSPAFVRVGTTLAHSKPSALRFGGLEATTSQSLEYVLDRFELR